MNFETKNDDKKVKKDFNEYFSLTL